ncbi:DnaB-like helicase N-terminal domain-containing protein [Actinocrinis sp.]|uniref:DnaB-like helicase N-terminal domain-containing protein n=1 Tax=Actinocrinis sp. TaxID=1920516 RepID=UPI002D74957F|nr:DnaB-like helicase N-terminal domain-containing protein [Actinocrinis sp.]HZP54633.1 DnaB-like helicase N-terminal domain-containing protein [Actinocrinis sp.]
MSAREEATRAAERAVLGAMLFHHSAVPEAATYLDADQFDEPRHGYVFTAATALHARSAPTNPAAVLDELHRLGHLHGSLNAAYVHALTDDACLTTQVGYYAAIITREARRRRLNLAFRSGLAALDETEGEDLPELAAKLTRDLTELASPMDGAVGPLDKFAFDGWSFLKHQGEHAEPVWGRRGSVAWPVGEACMLAGPPGVGKTTIAHQVLLGRIGIGGDVLGLPVVPTGSKVLYLAMDRPSQIARAFARLVSDEHEAVLRERLVWWAGPLPAVLEKEPWVLAELAERHGADTIVVDSIKDTIRKVADDESGNAYNRARQNVLAEGMQILELHHNRKAQAGQSREESLDAIFGSAWLTAGAGSVFGLYGDPGDPVVRMRHLKQSSGDLGSFDVVHDFDRGISQIDDGRDPLAILKRAANGITAHELAAALCAKASGPDRNEVEKARRKLDSFAAKGVAFKEDGARGGASGGQQARYWLMERQLEVAA